MRIQLFGISEQLPQMASNIHKSTIACRQLFLSHLEVKIHAEGEFEKLRVVQDKTFNSDFDQFLQEAGIDELSDDINVNKDGKG